MAALNEDDEEANNSPTLRNLKKAVHDTAHDTILSGCEVDQSELFTLSRVCVVIGSLAQPGLVCFCNLILLVLA